MLEELKRFGINTIKVAFDMDLHVNENVRKARDRVIQVGCENGFEVIPKRWSSNYKGIVICCSPLLSAGGSQIRFLEGW